MTDTTTARTIDRALHLPHPFVRVAAHFAGHSLHVTKPADGCGCVARCDCGRWARWQRDRRAARIAFRQHAVTSRRSVA